MVLGASSRQKQATVANSPTSKPNISGHESRSSTVGKSISRDRVRVDTDRSSSRIGLQLPINPYDRTTIKSRLEMFTTDENRNRSPRNMSATNNNHFKSSITQKVTRKLNREKGFVKKTEPIGPVRFHL